MRKCSCLTIIIIIVLVNYLSVFFTYSAKDLPNSVSFSSDGIDFNPHKASEGDLEKFLVINCTGAYQIDLSNAMSLPPHWFIHVPKITDLQCPIVLFDVWTTPVDIIKDYKLNSEDFSGNNFVLEIMFSDVVKKHIYKLFWSISIVITGDDRIPTYLEIPSKEDLPENVLNWLNSTDFIQTDNDEIQSKAMELSNGEANVINIVDNIIEFTGHSIEYHIDPENPYQDALSTLRRKSAVCTGKANLATALLRACGVPARVLMIYPTHFISECYLHPFGWVRVEPGLSKYVYELIKYSEEIYDSSYYYINAFTVYPEDESSSNEIGGFSPVDEGVPAYWAPTSTDIGLEIDLADDWEILYNEGSASKNSINSALNVTKRLWNFIISYNINQTYSELKRNFPKSHNLLLNALDELSNANLNEYISYITQALGKFEINDDNYEYIESVPIIRGVYVEVVISAILIQIALAVTLIIKRKIHLVKVLEK